jgi:hypothetical protein
MSKGQSDGRKTPMKQLLEQFNEIHAELAKHQEDYVRKYGYESGIIWFYMHTTEQVEALIAQRKDE